MTMIKHQIVFTGHVEEAPEGLFFYGDLGDNFEFILALFKHDNSVMVRIENFHPEDGEKIYFAPLMEFTHQVSGIYYVTGIVESQYSGYNTASEDAQLLHRTAAKLECVTRLAQSLDLNRENIKTVHDLDNTIRLIAKTLEYKERKDLS